ncbi:MAG: 30S ribosomal protein S21 [Bacteroidetes bacterium]|nr:MAG: 30S ribosomal protein S21 [Bacteroidota bacterium]
MLIIDVRSGESIDKALKRYKRKSINTRIIREVRNRREFIKPSVKRRQETMKAAYREQRLRRLEN